MMNDEVGGRSTMHCTNPDVYLKYALQALALSVDDMLDVPDFSHWKGILQGRDDWKPTPEQIEALKQVEATMGVEGRALRESSRLALAAFGWECEPPPKLDFSKCHRLGTITDRSPRYRIINVITQLNVVRHRPGMFFLGGVDGVINFLIGYICAIQALSLSSTKRIWDYVVFAYTSRGWKRNNLVTEPIPQMQERGWSDDAMVDEVICIYINALSQMLIDEGLME